MTKARIYHPYGRIGNIIELGSGVAFGNADVLDWVALSGEIHTYTEENSFAELQVMRNESFRAEALVFLGFGFHDLNMSLLAPPGSLDVKKGVFSTGKLSVSDCRAVPGLIAELFSNSARPFILANTQVPYGKSCAELFDEFELTLPRL